MKTKLILALSSVAILLVLATGCKKDDSPAPTYLLTALADSAGVDLTTFEYDAGGNLLRFGSSTNNYNYYYSNGKVNVRNNTSNGSIQNVDSFFYDGADRLTRVEDYDGSNTKIKTVTLSYNGDNTVNSLTEDYVSALTNDKLYEYTYSGSNVSERRTLEKTAGTFKLTSKLEFLGFDSKTNPFVDIHNKYLLDLPSLFYFVWSGANNATSAKETDYDVVTQNITGVTSVTITFQYNSNNLPTQSAQVIGTDTQIYTYKYKQK